VSDKLSQLMYDAGLTAQGAWDSMDQYQCDAVMKFAELIIKECVAQCGSQADRKSILKQFGLPVESNIKYSGPDAHWSVTSQYSREYNMPEPSKIDNEPELKKENL